MILPLFSRLCAALLLGPLALSAAPGRLISIDLNQVVGPRNPAPFICIGAGRAEEGLRQDWQEQLTALHRDCGFTFLRLHGLFHDDMGVVRRRPDGTLQFNWHSVDQLYDSILRAGMKPFVELSFMPKAMASGKKTVFWWNANVTAPKDWAEWSALVTACVSHLQDRYGRAEVKTWYFEVWNEPNHRSFSIGTMADYFTMYDASAAAIKAVCPDYRVGGPATSGIAWIPELIAHCHDGKVPLDFISTHTYGTITLAEGALDEYGTHPQQMRPDLRTVAEGVQEARRQIDHSALPDLELHFTEWSSSFSSRDPVHDSYFSAPYILENLKQAGTAAQSLSYWTFTDIFEEAGPPPTPFHGGFGLLNVDRLRKPAFFAYRWLSQSGDRELANSDPHSWVFRGDQAVTALIWDLTGPPPGVSNQAWFSQPRVPVGRPDAAFTVTGLAPGSYRLSTYRVGYHRNDAYTAYLDLGAPANLTREQLKALAAASAGDPESVESVAVGPDGRFQRTLPMRENDVWFLKLEPR